MPSMTFPYRVELQDGSTFEVTADQRDVARWEAQPFGCSAAEIKARYAVTATRYLAWSAASRQRLTDLKWPAFNEQCVEAIDLDEMEDGSPADAEDPGRTAPSA